MAIRVNLLPVRQATTQEQARWFVVWTFGVLLIAIAGNSLWYGHRASEHARLVAQAQDSRRRIAELERVIGEVNELNQRKKEVSAKLAVLEKLRSQRSGPLRMLDALSRAIPKNVWLSDFSERAGAVRLLGEAATYEDVAELSKDLKQMVWTPKGLARVVELKKDAATARVELLSGDAGLEDFSVGELSNFFDDVDIRSTEASTNGTAAPRFVKFELVMSANHAI